MTEAANEGETNLDYRWASDMVEESRRQFPPSSGRLGARKPTPRRRGRDTSKDIIEHNGIRQTVSKWSKERKIPIRTIKLRLYLEWEPAEILGFEPRQERYDYRGHSKTLKEWEEAIGIPESKLFVRIVNGWSIGQALGFEAAPKVATGS